MKITTVRCPKCGITLVIPTSKKEKYLCYDFCGKKINLKKLKKDTNDA